METHSNPRPPAPYLPPEICSIISQFVHAQTKQTRDDSSRPPHQQLQTLKSMRLVNHGFAGAGLDFLFETASVKGAIYLFQQAQSHPSTWNRILAKVKVLFWNCPIPPPGSNACPCDLHLRFRKALARLLKHLTRLHTLHVDIDCSHASPDLAVTLQTRIGRWGMLLDYPETPATFRHLFYNLPADGRSTQHSQEYWLRLFEHTQVGRRLDTLSVSIEGTTTIELDADSSRRLSTLKNLTLHSSQTGTVLKFARTPLSFSALEVLDLCEFHLDTRDLTALLQQVSSTIQHLRFSYVQLNRGWGPVLNAMRLLPHLLTVRLARNRYGPASSTVSAPSLDNLLPYDIRFLAKPFMERCSASSFKLLCHLFRACALRQIAGGHEQEWLQSDNVVAMVSLAVRDKWTTHERVGFLARGFPMYFEKRLENSRMHHLLSKNWPGQVGRLVFV